MESRLLPPQAASPDCAGPSKNACGLRLRSRCQPSWSTPWS